MSAIVYLDNDIKIQYRNLVCTSKDTSFLNKYLELPEIKRLAYRMQFCGCDETNIHDSIIASFTRLDHSIIVAMMTYHFTNSKAQAVAALFHDVLTPAFAHANDFRKGDALHQKSSEINVFDTFVISKELLEYLKEDNINIDEILNIKKYPILENSSPKLCTDRLDGVIHTNLIWRPYWSISDVNEIYSNVVILKNENKIPEIGFNNIEIAEEFGNGIYKYAKALQMNETNYTLQFVADILQCLIDEKLLTEEDIHKNLSEDAIVNIILNSSLNEPWRVFNEASEIIRTNTRPKDLYYFSSKTEVKKRVVDPLCLYKDKTYRLSEISSKFYNQLRDYYSFKDSEYSHIKGLKKFH